MRTSAASPIGVHRVLEPAGASLPQAARRLDPSPELWPDEVRIAVETLNLDAASYRQLADKHTSDGVLDGAAQRVPADRLGGVAKVARLPADGLALEDDG